MLNASDMFLRDTIETTLAELFPVTAAESPVDVVRIACHAREFIASLPAATWLHDRGYRVGFNIMQIADRSRDEVTALAREATQYPIEVLYFADSMGGMTPAQTREIITWLKEEWPGEVGVHTHDNMGLALSNTLAAIEAGATWVDATVTGMGRGPGNARTEELALELAPSRDASLSGLLDLVADDFEPMKTHYGWGTNPFYYLSGKYGIHPTYIQEMLGDKRFNTEDILSVIDHLRQNRRQELWRGDPLGRARLGRQQRRRRRLGPGRNARGAPGAALGQWPERETPPRGDRKVRGAGKPDRHWPQRPVGA